MTKLFIIRHGESQANSEGKFVGHTDSGLSGLGKRQAELTAEYITSQNRIDKVYASDLKRAFYTGKAVADRAGLEVIPERGLREIKGGLWENTAFDDLEANYGEPYRIWLTDIGNSACPGGESVSELMERIVATVKKIASENDGKNVVIATHATPIRAFQCFCENKPLSEMKDIPWVSNASVTTAEYSDGELKLTEVGHDGHLGEIKTELPDNV